jgi:nucleotide-binding universal stress UspA family protein
MFERIVVPVDRSEFSEAAIPPAIAIAKRTGATLHLVIVRAGLSTLAAQPAPVVIQPDFDIMLEREARAYIDRLADRVADSDVRVKADVVDGPVARSILRYARRNHADLIVMTTHGLGGFRRAWLGSVADTLLRWIRIPLLLIRPSDSISPPAPIESFSNVLVALDGSRTAEHAMDRSAGLPFGADSKCTLLRVASAPWIPVSPYLPDTVRVNQEEMEARTTEAERYLDRMANRAAEHWRTIDRHVIGAYRVAETILEDGTEIGADLIVVGTHGGRLRRAALGSVADKVIRGANVPVFVLPARSAVRERTDPHRVTAGAMLF